MFGILHLRNRITQNDVTLRVTNSKVFIETFKLLFFYFRVTNSKLKNKKIYFELLTQNVKIKSFISSF